MLAFAIQKMCQALWEAGHTREQGIRQLVPSFWIIVKSLGEDVVERHDNLRTMLLDVTAIGFCKLQGPEMESLGRDKPSFASLDNENPESSASTRIMLHR